MPWLRSTLLKTFDNMNYRIFPPEEILETSIDLPLSKSVAARALVLAALTPDAPAIPADKLPVCTDTRVLTDALGRRSGTVDVADCGTAARFLTAFFAATPGADVFLTGAPRLCSRPIAPLVEALQQLGADITYAERPGHLPLRIKGCALKGGRVNLNAAASSQFASALAMVAPLCPGGLSIDLGGEIASMPYLRMTIRMMQARGIDAELAGYTLMVPHGTYKEVEAEVEPDWSAAAFWYSIAAVSAGWVTLPGLAPGSLQGDSVLAEIGPRFGTLTEFTSEGAELSATPDIWGRLDMNLADYPDLVPPLAVAAYLVGQPFQFSGLANLRHKESDRIEAIAAGLRACGAVPVITADSLGWEGERVPLTAVPVIDPAADHRIAMAFAAASIFIPGIVINDADVAAKSYPGFWDDMRHAGFIVTDASEPLPAPAPEQ